jgi:GNAT superfamily N-acetyltransferase
MAQDRVYPDEPAGPFPSPPISFTDREEREIEVRAYDGTEQEHEALVEMYVAFDSADRAQGIPPTDERRIRSWLDEILENGHNVIAWDGDAAAGHATLVPQGDAYELAIFVLQKYQEAGIGTRLIKGLLGYGQDNGVERVWLTVERWNQPAVNLYRKIGFEPSDAESFELEMSLLLAPEQDH